MEKIILVKSNIGRKLKRIRLEAGLSQKDIADRISVRRETIGRWERGDNIPRKICENKLNEILIYLEDLIKVKNKKFKISHKNTRLPELH